MGPVRREDGGSTLIETVMSIAVIAMVMASVTTFFLQTTAVSRKQAQTQTAARLAVDAMEDVALLPGDALLAGRPESAVVTQWRAPGVDAYLHPAKTRLAWSSSAATAQTLPTAPLQVNDGGTGSIYERSWYVGECWQPRGRLRECTGTFQQGHIQMYRVVVAVTWRSKDCAAQLCSYVTATLTAGDDEDPTFGL